MKNHPPIKRPLVLNRETIRTIVDVDLRAAIGGATKQTIGTLGCDLSSRTCTC
jgi:hypothetical protein